MSADSPSKPLLRRPWLEGLESQEFRFDALPPECIGIRMFEEYEPDTRMWICNGARHRTDGPAMIKPDGSVYW